MTGWHREHPAMTTLLLLDLANIVQTLGDAIEHVADAVIAADTTNLEPVALPPAP